MENNKKDQSFMIWAMVITAVVILGTVYMVVNRNGSGSANSDQNLLTGSTAGNAAPAPSPSAPNAPAGSVPVDISQVKTAGEPFVGKANAPVTIALWFDYQCPFCKELEQSMMPSLLTDYIDKGLVKLVYKDFTFLGPDSQTASLIARAVWDAAPDKFYDWNNMMFANQGQENGGWATQDKVLALTATVPGIDVNKVKQLLAANSAKYQQEIDADKAEGSSFGITGTPGLIIGKQLVVGAQPYSSIKQLIDLQLAANK